MTRIIFIISIFTLSYSYYLCAEELGAFTTLCIPSAATGFNWENDHWVQVSFKNDQFLIKKIVGEPKKPQNEEFDEIAWEVRHEQCLAHLKYLPEISEHLESYPVCVSKKNIGDEDWDIYTCDESHFKRKDSTDSYGKVRLICSNYHVDISFLVNGDYIRSVRAHDIFKHKEKDSLVMEVGTCSTIDD